MSTLMQSSGSQSGRNCPLFDGQGGEKAKGLMGDKTTQQVKNSQPLNVIDHWVNFSTHYKWTHYKWFIVSYDSANKQKHHKSHRMQ